MTLPVFLGPVTGVAVGDSVVVEGDEARHAVVVRRTRVGEEVVLVDGAGSAATCSVTSTSKTSLTALVSAVSLTPPPAPHVTVVQAIPKGDRGELAVEVLTEIGVDRIVPWAAARSVGVWRGERAERSLAKWRSTARESGKQSRRPWLPEVTPVASTAEVVSLLEAADLAVVLHEGASAPMSALSLDGVASILVVVGPEGGITDEELEAFGAAHVVRLGES
ncbi:MAG: rsmE, partial [Marmoricola sp.]|nr:rsmE [Marmoricola sp.]